MAAAVAWGTNMAATSKSLGSRCPLLPTSSSSHMRAAGILCQQSRPDCYCCRVESCSVSFLLSYAELC